MKLAVMIPAKNEETVVSRTILSILGSNIQPSDIFLIDDGSTDNTGVIAATHGVNVLRNEVNLGKASSILKATKHFRLVERYDLIALMDADTQINANYFMNVLEKFEACPEAAAVCGRALSLPHNALTAYRACSYFLTNFLYKQGQSNMGVITVAPGCATTYRSGVFEVLDWSKDTLVEDMDVTVQVQRMYPGSIVYENKARVVTQDPRTTKDYVKQMDRWQVGAWQVFKKHKIFIGNKKLDWEMKLLWGEGLVFSLLFSISPLLILFHRGLIGRVLELDFIGLFLVSLCCAVSEKRWDVLYYCPLYELFRFVDAFVFLRAFWKVVLINKPTEGWASPKRY